VSKLNEFARDLFKSAQAPVSWLLSAERLRDAAESVLRHEQQFEIPYFRAYEAAQQKAVGLAYAEGQTEGIATIEAIPPNYPPAQLLYAFAIENVLKGLIVVDKPHLINNQKLDRALTSHDLIALARRGGFTVHPQEEPVLKALSELSVWAGRYPVARTRREHAGTPTSDELLDFGSAHPIMRMFFDRARRELEDRLPRPIGNRFGAVVVFRQPGL
jgi:hypothetical protein